MSAAVEMTMIAPGRMPICRGCVFEDLAACLCPKSKTNGGTGIFIKPFNGAQACSGREIAFDAKLFIPGTFPDCPMLCDRTNLPAFPDAVSALMWHDKTCPRCKLVRKPWLCDFCNSWHYETKAPSPSGGSSGTERQ